ncbi:hypothetical protein ACP70R_029651 [Stipagrostis hirtigluma subsp. patula]
MGNGFALPAHEPAGIRAGEPPLRQLGLFPRLRGRRFGAGVLFTLWGVSGILCTTVPGVSVNPDHVMVYFTFFMAGVVLLLLGVAAPDLPVADRAADRLEGVLMDIL